MNIFSDSNRWARISDDILVRLHWEDQDICVSIDMMGYFPYSNGDTFGTVIDDSFISVEELENLEIQALSS